MQEAFCSPQTACPSGIWDSPGKGPSPDALSSAGASSPSFRLSSAGNSPFSPAALIGNPFLFYFCHIRSLCRHRFSSALRIPGRNHILHPRTYYFLHAQAEFMPKALIAGQDLHLFSKRLLTVILQIHCLIIVKAADTAVSLILALFPLKWNSLTCVVPQT